VSIRRTEDGRWQVRWYLAGRGSPRRQRTFDRKRDAEDFETEVRRRRALGELGLLELRNRSVRELAREWWRKYVVPNLADWTLTGYEPMLAKHIEPRLGSLRVGEVSPEVVADFRGAAGGRRRGPPQRPPLARDPAGDVQAGRRLGLAAGQPGQSRSQALG
jgi:hypothetical protein